MTFGCKSHKWVKLDSSIFENDEKCFECGSTITIQPKIKESKN